MSSINKKPTILTSVGDYISGPGVLVYVIAASTGTAGNVIIKDGYTGPIICQLRVATTGFKYYPSRNIIVPFINGLYVYTLGAGIVLHVFYK